jgi:hypothetical protein
MSLTFAPETIELFPQAAIAEVEQTITRHQRGRVEFMATTWFARFYHPNCAEALPGMPVRVIGREGLTLLVVPMDGWIHPLIPIADQPEANQSDLPGWMQQIGSWLTCLSQRRQDIMHHPHQHGYLFRFASKVLKFFGFGLFGLGIACLLSIVFGAFPLVEVLISLLRQWLVRVTVVVICLMATAVVIESVR